MKLSDWAKRQGVTYRTSWNLFKANQIEGAYKLPTGTIIVPDPKPNAKSFIVTYARVSSSENKDNLEGQSKRLEEFCIANGWSIDKAVKEVGSGLNDNRKKLLSVLEKDPVTKLVVEHKDRLTRFGFNFIELLCRYKGCEIIIVNKTETKDELMEDFVSLVTSFCARLYGQRRNNRRTESLIKELKDQ